MIPLKRTNLIKFNEDLKHSVIALIEVSLDSSSSTVLSAESHNLKEKMIKCYKVEAIDKVKSLRIILKSIQRGKISKCLT